MQRSTLSGATLRARPQRNCASRGVCLSRQESVSKEAVQTGLKESSTSDIRQKYDCFRAGSADAMVSQPATMSCRTLCAMESDECHL